MNMSDTPISNAALLKLAGAHRILLLQGPIGPFFCDLATCLRDGGRQVRKINFNGGDWRFFREGEAYRGGLDQWAAALSGLLAEFRPDVCVMFGQDRPVHRIARTVLAQQGITPLVFEEGYVRPQFVTFEAGGVNALSSFAWSRAWPAPPDFGPLPRRNAKANTAAIERLFPAERSFALPFKTVAALAMEHQIFLSCSRPLFSRYQHHRSFSVAWESLCWVRSGTRKLLAKSAEAELIGTLLSAHSKRYFLVPLQVQNDSQLRFYSGFESVDAFITQTLQSFAQHATADCKLVFKHHPMDRGHCSYGSTITSEARTLGIFDRVHYLQDGHLPDLLDHAAGTVVVNSTVGLSSLWHGTPVKVCGQALYDQAGLTYQGALHDFWRAPGSVDVNAFASFRAQLIAQTQLPGSFYWPDNAYAGLLDAVAQAVATVPVATAAIQMAGERP